MLDNALGGELKSHGTGSGPHIGATKFRGWLI